MVFGFWILDSESLDSERGGCDRNSSGFGFWILDFGFWIRRGEGAIAIRAGADLQLHTAIAFGMAASLYDRTLEVISQWIDPK